MLCLDDLLNILFYASGIGLVFLIVDLVMVLVIFGGVLVLYLINFVSF